MKHTSDPKAYTAHEHAWEMVEEEFCTAERFGTWLQNVNDVRQQSAYWGAIGNAELVKILLGKNQSWETGLAAIRTLRRRFLAEHCEQIAARTDELMEQTK